MSNFYKSYLRFVGLWKPSKSTYAIFYNIYGLSFLFIFSFLYTFCMSMKIFFLNNVKDTSTVLFMSLNEVSLFIKVVYFYMQNRKIQALFSELNDFDLDNIEEHDLVANRLSYFWKVNLFYYIIANWATCTTEIAALFAEETMLPFSGWYPGFDWEHNARDYWTIFLYQCAGMMITCNMSMTVDMYPCFFIYVISIQLRIVGRRVRALGHEITETSQNTRTIYSSNGKIKEKENELRATSELIRCIKNHQNILRQTEVLQSYFTMSFLSLIAISGIVICSMSNELSRVSHFINTFSLPNHTL